MDEVEPGTEREQRPDRARQEEMRRIVMVWTLIFAAVFIAGRFVPFKPLQRFYGYFRWLTEQALRLAEELFESYGYLTVFLAPLLENTIFLGAILPGTLIMLLAGLGAHDGLIDLWPAIPLGIAGAWIGDTISYGIGRFGWQKLGPESRLVRMSERMRGPLLEQSAWIVVLYHFFGYSRLIGPAASGFFRMPFARWVLLDYFGSAIWVVAYIMGGYLLGGFGLSLEATDKNVRVFELILFALAVVAIVVVLRRAEGRAAQTAEEGEVPADGTSEADLLAAVGSRQEEPGERSD